MLYSRFLCVFGAFLYVLTCSAQERYWVCFTDKQGVEFDPVEYFDSKAIERRIRQNISICDSSDFPVKQEYIDKIGENCSDIHTISRWFNAVSVGLLPEQLLIIQNFPFVKSVISIESSQQLASYNYKTELSRQQKRILANQTERMQGSLFKSNNINGNGIRIAIFDAGFPSVGKNPAFAHIRSNNRIVKTYDFARKRENVFSNSVHGTMVFSCIAGIVNEKYIGLASGAEFLLARIEVRTEPQREEENWMAAMEWADKNGADIINSSLGYTYHRYFTENMDGTSLVAQAADVAAAKGILVINSMGNDGVKDWKILSTPADAESVLSVGGISPDTDYHADYSSFGPTADLRCKPNVVAYGRVIAAGEWSLTEVQGTSFAAPLITGFAACAWQTNRNLTNKELFLEIEKSGDLYPYFDYAHGYGVPQASYFINTIDSSVQKKKPIIPTFEFDIVGDTLTISVFQNYIDRNKDSHNYLYYHIQNSQGTLDKYAVIEVYQSEVIKFPTNQYVGTKLSVFYKAYIQNYDFK